MRRFPSLACLAVLILAGGACGRSDLFSAHRSCAPGDLACVEPDGGAGGDGPGGGTGGSVTGYGGTGGSAGGRAGSVGLGGRGGRGGTSGSVGGRGGTSARGGMGGGVGGRGGVGGSVGGRGGTSARGGMGGGVGGRGGTGGCAPGGREICNNGKDDNCNQLVDCLDPGCFGDPICAPLGTEICNNGLDDDGDGAIDCADPDCMGSLACKPTMGTEICNNGIDDNNDRLVDCSDPQCTTFPSCLTVSCTPDLDFGTLATHGAKVLRTFDTRAATKGYASCAPTGGVGRVGRFQLDATADVRLDFTQPSSSAHVIGLYRAGANQACDRNPIPPCVDAKDLPTANQTFPSLAAGVYWVIVESYPSVPGSTTVTLSTGALASPEICANGKDDDGNGLVDCQDGACVKDPSCVGSECVPDLNLGTLVVDGASHEARVNLASAANRYHPTCSGNVPGGDVAITFTLAEPAGLLVAFQQTGQSIFALYSMPAPGLACDADQLACAIEDDLQHPANSVAFPGLSAGRYVFIVKAKSVAAAGQATLRFSAFSGRRIEICGNGIDDDGNGLTDCADAACFGLGGCAAPACVADPNIGAISDGVTKSATVDTRNGGTFYQTECSRGNGREQVIRLTLTEPMELDFNCTDTGSHVMELSLQQNALDACNEHPVSCVDPAGIPFKCNFGVPGLQPGTYNLIVQAFQAGNEGIVNLNLTGRRETGGPREICDNGLDDDGDGAIDCADRKCVTATVCEKLACRADNDLTLLPLDGTPSSVVVQTAMAGDDQKTTSCASATGGQDGDIDFQLPAKADLTLEWAQVGDHDFALYSDEGALFACDAGTSFACLASDGIATGTHVFTALPSGRYHLVVDADRPGKEGGVVLQISAVASVTP